MKLKFLAKGVAPISYEINGSVINGIDTALFPEGAAFVGNEDTVAAGIYNMFWQDGELHVVLGQMTKVYQFPIAAREGDWIDANNYNPDACYVTATSPEAVAVLSKSVGEFFRDTDGKWSVRILETAEQEPAV